MFAGTSILEFAFIETKDDTEIRKISRAERETGILQRDLRIENA